MKKTGLVLIVLIGAAVITAALPSAVLAQSDESISVTAIDTETFITVKETAGGDVVSLYKIRDNRIVHMDTVVNTSKRAVNLPTRYIQHQEVENR